MRTHARYELQQESNSIEEAGTASPRSVGSGIMNSRSMSSESSSADPQLAAQPQPMPPLPPQPEANKPPSPMDTHEGDKKIA